MSYEDKALQQRPPWTIGCDHPLDGHTRHGPWCEGGAGNQVRPERILPEYQTVEVPDLMEAIHQALGAASVSWEPMDCTGTFQGERCVQIGAELFEIIRQWADGRDIAMSTPAAAPPAT